MLNKCDIKNFAKQTGWDVIDNTDSCLLSFNKKIDDYNARINVWWTTGTVATCIDHPKRGKTQLFRRKVNAGVLKRIFENPRLHTGKGYYTK